MVTAMYESPRDRRLKADLEAMKRLRGQSSILDFSVLDDPPTRYRIAFKGMGLMQAASAEGVVLTDQHQVEIRLGSNYPRSKPDLKWLSPIFHPNISALGQVCLGGYSTHWVPSLNLDELSEMLWDMLRFANFDTKSPYNYKAARWVERQHQYHFPLDDRPLRDLVARGIVKDTDVAPEVGAPPPAPKPAPPQEEIVFIGGSENEPKEEDKPPEDVLFIGNE